MPARPPTDVAGDFARQFHASFRSLWLVAIGVVRDAGWAEDVVQEAAIIGLGKRDEFRPGTNFRAWMAQIVRNVALNHARREKRRRSQSLDAPDSDAAERVLAGDLGSGNYHLSPRGHLSSDQEHFDDRVVAALRGVSDTARACLLLRTVEGLEYSEIAAMLEIPPGTAMSHVHRTRIYLRERLASDSAPPPEGTA